MNKTIARRTIKAVTMRNLQGNWLKAFLFTILSSYILTYTLLFLPIYLPTKEELVSVFQSGMVDQLLWLFFPDGITNKILALIGIVLLLNLFIASPFKIGRCRYFLSVAKGEKAKFGQFFSPITDINVVFSSIILNVFVFIVSLFWAMIFLVLPIGVSIVGQLLGSVLLQLSGSLLFIVATIFSVLWNSRYNFVFLIFAEGDVGVFGAYRKFVQLMRNHNRECLTLRATYFGWDLAMYIFAPLSIVYQTLCEAVYAKYLSYLKGELSVGEPAVPPEM